MIPSRFLHGGTGIRFFSTVESRLHARLLEHAGVSRRAVLAGVHAEAGQAILPPMKHKNISLDTINPFAIHFLPVAGGAASPILAKYTNILFRVCVLPHMSRTRVCYFLYADVAYSVSAGRCAGWMMREVQ